MELLLTNTKEFLFSTFQKMPSDEFQRELQSILSARDIYMENHCVDSPVFAYIDEVYEIVRDVLVAKSLPA